MMEMNSYYICFEYITKINCDMNYVLVSTYDELIKNPAYFKKCANDSTTVIYMEEMS